MPQIFHVLLTGGVGSRLWPLSRLSRPKQYLQLFSDVASGGPNDQNATGSHSLFELAVKRNAAFADGLIVVGNQGNLHLSVQNLEKLEVGDYTHIVEATPRNTAPAIAFAAFAAQPEDILLITPADHIIKEGEAYEKAISQAIALAKNDAIVTFGINPSRPETGYGYIEFAGEEVLCFREKPNTETAKEFLRKGNFLWNSGMFCFKAGVFLEELQKHSPEVYQKSLDAWNKAGNNLLELQSSLIIPAISVDYAVMEKSEKIKVVKSYFEWSDMGSFEAVYDYLVEQGHPVDELGNMVIGSNTYTAFVGMRNTILIFTENANLVLQKEVSQDIKQLYQQLELNNPDLIG